MKYSIEQSTLTAIGDSIRAKSGLTEAISPLDMPNAIDSISSGGESDDLLKGLIERSLTEIIIPLGITRIGSYLFYSSSLTSITIPNSVTSVGRYAFYGCNLREIHLKPTTPPTLSDTNAFNGISSRCIMYVPKGCLEAYQSATNWSSYASYMMEEE